MLSVLEPATDASAAEEVEQRHEQRHDEQHVDQAAEVERKSANPREQQQDHQQPHDRWHLSVLLSSVLTPLPCINGATAFPPTSLPGENAVELDECLHAPQPLPRPPLCSSPPAVAGPDRKSTRLNSSHLVIS